MCPYLHKYSLYDSRNIGRFGIDGDDYIVSELIDADVARFGVFDVWDKEWRPPAWQHNNTLHSWGYSGVFYVWDKEGRPPAWQHNNTLHSWDKPLVWGVSMFWDKEGATTGLAA